MSHRAVGVIGAGVMGVGLAHALAESNHRVILVDVSEQVLEQAQEKIWQSVRLSRLFKKGAKDIKPGGVIERIIFTADYRSLEEADFVIENVTEKWRIKQAVYMKIDEICDPEVIFAANTSAIPITRIASATTRADRVIGMHFMNPVPVKPMVEVIRGYHTSDSTVEASRQLIADMGKECIVINDSPGFVSNRVLMLTINEAIWLVKDQVASAQDINRIFKTCFEHKLGPLETADLIGLDTILFSIEALYESYMDSKFRPCPLLTQMVDAGLLGRKSGKGFYDYTRTAASGNDK